MNVENRQKVTQITATTAGIAAGVAVHNFTDRSIKSINSIPWKKIMQICQTIDNGEIKSKIPLIFVAAGLKDKGIRISNFSNCDFSQQIRELRISNDAILKNKKIGIFKKFKQVINYVKRSKRLKHSQIYALGRNAGFGTLTNIIYINLDKTAVSLTHEIGHAQNRHLSTFWNIIQRSRRYTSKTILAIALTAILKPPKCKEEKSHGVIDKATDFVKNNAGKLTALASVPIIAEEIKASINGNKIAKQLYTPELYNKVLKHTKLAAMTYVIAGIAPTAAVWAAKNVRDKVAKLD